VKNNGIAAKFSIALIFVDLPRQQWRAPDPKIAVE
jgi:hypothetical protein